MKPEYELYHQIDNYLNNKLSETDGEHFKQLLKDDAMLAEQVTLQSLTNELIIEKRFNDIYNTVASTYEADKMKLKNKLFFLGASLFIASATLFYFYSGDKHNSLQTIANQTKVKVENSIDLAPQHLITPIDKKQKQQVIISNHKLDSIVLPITTIQIPAIEKNNEVLAEDIETKNSPVSAQILPTVRANNCDEVVINAQLYQTQSCEEAANGSINIATTSIQGGKSPYVFSINGGLDFQPSANFENLAKGNYQVVIKDILGCTTTIDKAFQLTSKKCYTAHNFSFNPIMGETWVYALDASTDYLVKVLNKQGQIIWKSSNAASQVINWDGNTINGDLLATGVYVYEIDFSNGDTQTGTITILK